MDVVLQQLVIEMGVSHQPLQQNFDKYRGRVMWSWLVSLWEKCSIYGVKIVFNESFLRLPRERDKWLMREFERMGFTKVELEILNRVRLYQQVLFLSDILGVSGRDLDERYLRRRPPSEKWSVLQFPKERPSAQDFRLWKTALRQIVPAGGIRMHLGRFLHDGYKVWEWRVSVSQQLLLHYHGGAMDVYEPTSELARRWELCEEGCQELVLGLPCAVRLTTQNRVMLRSVATAPDPVTLPEGFFEVLKGWGQTWMWKSLRLVGNEDWILDAVREGTLITVTDGSYIREMDPNVCSCAFVLECSQGRGRIIGDFPERSRVANAYRGELSGLLAIHLILLAVNKVEPHLRGSVKIYSYCLGALTKVTTLPANIDCRAAAATQIF